MALEPSQSVPLALQTQLTDDEFKAVINAHPEINGNLYMKLCIRTPTLSQFDAEKYCYSGPPYDNGYDMNTFVELGRTNPAIKHFTSPIEFHLLLAYISGNIEPRTENNRIEMVTLMIYPYQFKLIRDEYSPAELELLMSRFEIKCLTLDDYHVRGRENLKLVKRFMQNVAAVRETAWNSSSAARLSRDMDSL